MNNTCIYCYLLLHDGRIESLTQAKLIIQSLTPSYTSTQQASATCVLSPDQQATTIVPSGPHSLSLVFCITSMIASTLKHTVAPLSSSLYNKPVHTNVPSNLQNHLISKPKKVVLTQNLYTTLSL